MGVQPIDKASVHPHLITIDNLQYFERVGGELNYMRILHKYAAGPEPCSIEVIRYLINSKININSGNKNGNTVLHKACKNKKLDFGLIKFIIDNGGFVNRDNLKEQTPIYFLLKNKNFTLDIVDYLVENGAKFNIELTFNKISSKNKHLFDLMSLLNRNYLYHYDNQSLFYCVKNIHFKSENLLFFSRLNLNIHLRNKSGNNLLLTYCTNENLSLETLKVFFQLNVKPDYNNKKQNPLHVVLKNRNSSFDILNFLFDNHVQIFRDINGNTPLHIAFSNKLVTFPIIKLLVEKKCSPTEKNLHGDNPLNLALKSKKIFF